MRYTPFILAGLIAAATAAAGCSATPAMSSQYKTVRDMPNRDNAKAREGNVLAIALLYEGRFEEAEAQLKKALAADVTFGPAHNNLGKVYYHQNKFYLSAWEFQNAIKLMPHHPEPRNNLGLVLEAVGKLDDAISLYGEALDLQPDNPHMLGNLARARLRRGDRGDTIRQILGDLIMRDTRSDWVNWARRRLALLGRTDQ